MHMVRMVSTSVHDYAGHRMQVGQEFDCEEQHVELMRKLGRAKPAEEQKQEQQSYETRHMEAAPVRGVRRRRK